MAEFSTVDKNICELNHKNINEKIDRLEKKHVEDFKHIEQRFVKIENNNEIMLKLTFEVSQMRKELNDIIPRLADLETKPAKKYEALINYVAFAIIGGLITYIFSQIGLK